MTYDFCAPQSGNFSSLFNNEMDVSDFFDVDHEASVTLIAENQTSFVGTRTSKIHGMEVPLIKILCATPSKVLNAVDSPCQNGEQHNHSTSFGPHQSSAATTPNQVQGASTSRVSASKPRSGDRSARRRSLSCPEKNSEGTEMDREALLSESLIMLSLSGKKATSTPQTKQPPCESFINLSASSSLQQTPLKSCGILTASIRSKRKLSPPPPNERDYSQQPEKYISMVGQIPTPKSKMLRMTGRQVPKIKKPLRLSPRPALEKNGDKKKIPTNIMPTLGNRVPRRPSRPGILPFKPSVFRPKEVKTENTVKVFQARPQSVYKTSASGVVKQTNTSSINASHKLDRVFINQLVYGEAVRTRKQMVPYFGLPQTGLDQVHKSKLVPQPFSFEARDLQMRKRREERLKEIENLEKMQRQYHANPPPVYPKPKTLRTTLKATQAAQAVQERMKPQHRRHKSVEVLDCSHVPSYRARPPTVLHKDPFIPKKPERPPVRPLDIKLNTERRAKAREEFEQTLKERDLELQELRQKRAEEEQRRQMAEIARLRKELIHKARPVPDYVPFVPKQSDKVLTSPHTPAFSHKLKNTYVPENMDAD